MTYTNPRTKIDVYDGIGDNKVKYTIFEAMKHPIENHSIFYLNVIDRLDDDYMNLHSEFPDFDDFKDCDCTYTKLTKFPICVEISNVINVGAGVIDILKAVEVVAVQPPLLSMEQLQPPVIIANKIQIKQMKEATRACGIGIAKMDETPSSNYK
ncbi:hypothetical protein CR513_51705, partial [Mucuna pruriens]